ncbi:hypothetical protein FDP41_011614 [Naegleria fowleri]|uniref:DUF4116 domain-containing protein n=1 Tax=Naegleria fowleri TaxID=5763 RepID=A0A6A5C862_NAEFO|nr:uncharacterized protein FDP41_011614 [Naegleria fowleri]KAF0982684.1 hypothetical protein FDP41_011614 [Naegleria fowleri]
MKRRLSHHDCATAALDPPAIKHTKSSNSIIISSEEPVVVKIIHHLLSEPLVVDRMYQLLQQKFENQSKGFCKWLKAKEKVLKESHGPIEIEFMNDEEYVIKRLCDGSWYFPMKWITTSMDISKLCENNEEMIGRIDFWRPFKTSILKSLSCYEMKILHYIPKEFFFEYKKEISEIFQNKWEFTFLFDLDDFDQAMHILTFEWCQLFQLSERLRDNEEVVKQAIQRDPSNTRYASERLKKDRKFCMDMVRSNYDVFPELSQELQRDTKFIMELLNTTSINEDDGTIQEDLLSTRCNIPELINHIGQDILNELPLETIMQVFQQLFLKDAPFCLSNKDMLRLVLQMLHHLPDEYYRAHKNYQRHLTQQGQFARSLFENWEESFQEELGDHEYVILFAQVMNRVYMHFDQGDLKNDEEFISKRVDLRLMMKYSQICLRHDRNFVLKAVERNGTIFNEISYEKFRNDKKIVLVALSSENPCSYNNIPHQFHKDKECLLTALENAEMDDHLLDYQFSRYVEMNDRDIIIAAIKKDGEMLSHLPINFKQDTNFILKCVTEYPHIMDYLLETKDVLVNDEIISEYVKHSGVMTKNLLNWLCKKYFNDRNAEEISLDEAASLLYRLRGQRLEFEYFGCHIPQNHLLKEPIKLLEGHSNVFSKSDFCIEQDAPLKKYNSWKEYLFGNASWEIFEQCSSGCFDENDSEED